MPTGPRPKGPRLWLEPERRRPGRIPSPASWTIRDDGGYKQRLGIAPDDRAAAERELEAYLAKKRQIPAGERDPTQRLTADVLALYLRDVAPSHKRTGETVSRVERLGRFWGDPAAAMTILREADRPERMTGCVADVRTSTCQAYLDWVGFRRSAAIDLAILKAAINHAYAEKLLDRPVPVWMPEKSVPRDRWLTRSEAARIVWALWRARGSYEGRDTAARPTAHIARFVVASLYTGTRKAAVLLGAFERIPGFGYVDLDLGVWHRQSIGRAATRKRQPPLPIPGPLLAHMRRWRRNGARFLVEYKGQPVERLDKPFRRLVRDLGFDDVVIHTLRHTAISWALQRGMQPWDASDYFGVSLQVLTTVYAHHSPHHLREAADIMARPPARRQGGDRVSGTK